MLAPCSEGVLTTAPTPHTSPSRSSLNISSKRTWLNKLILLLEGIVSDSTQPNKHGNLSYGSDTGSGGTQHLWSPTTTGRIISARKEILTGHHDPSWHLADGLSSAREKREPSGLNTPSLSPKALLFMEPQQKEWREEHSHFFSD